MALKSTIYKAHVHLADMDRGLYAEHSLTLALHPSETEERLMVRLLAYALHTPADDTAGALQFAKGLSDTDEPDLWQHDLTSQLLHWIEVGQPDERRLSKACARSERVTVYAYASSTPVWWAALAPKVSRLDRLSIWQIEASQSQALATLAQRSMQWQVSVQDAQVWVHSDHGSVELTPRRLHGS
jgi:uncharacterized protein YaeQ